MHVWAAIVGAGIIFAILLDAFETIVLPRRVQRGFRLTAFFYRNTWNLWTRIAMHIRKPSRRENFLGYFGPLSLIVLLGFWLVGLIVGFAFVQRGLGEHLQGAGTHISFGTLLYHSGETFFTLGYGDITPNNTPARVLAVMEAGMGFAFLGVVIGYLPVVYSAFSTREIEISLLDARAGSPPSAAEFFGRLGCCPEQSVLDDIFRDWERWCADLLSTHISYPVLLFFRSQHSNQSWLAALTSILDITSMVTAGVNGIHPEQAKLTFAMARHAMVDLSQVLDARYDAHDPDRLNGDEVKRLHDALGRRGVTLSDGAEAPLNLADLRLLYEPYAHALARRLYMTLPPWVRTEYKKDNWQGGPWDRAIQARALERPGHVVDDHF
ncbi:MAG: two pore domain potassium channel family protein [Acidobacteria bacterium]|nr:two pore domain potassium channel family protein [Acidobacteriota bacterium]